MGNNTSTTRKSLAAVRHNAPFRKSNQSHQSQSNHHNLEEEFSDLILHEVKRQKYDPSVSADGYTSVNLLVLDDGMGNVSQGGDQLGHFSNDLLEDEYNELSHGILENGAGEEVLRSILPNEAVDTVVSAGLAGSANMIDEPVSGDIGGGHQLAGPMDTTDDASLQTPSSYVTGDYDAQNSMVVDSPNAAGGVSDSAPASLSGSVSGSGILAGVDFTRAALPAMARQRPQAPTARLSGGISGSGSDSVPPGSVPGNNSSRTSINQLVPVRIKWVNQTRENIAKVSIIGSFLNWRDVIKLKRSLHHPSEYLTTVKLPLGVHKLLYVVNNEYRVLELLPTATDQEGIFFNWFEVLDPRHLFNNNPNIYHHSNLSLSGDGGIIQVAGEHDASQIQRKSMSFLAKVSKQEKGTMSEHVEFAPETTPGTAAGTAGETMGSATEVTDLSELSSGFPTTTNYQTYHDHSSTSLIEESYSTETMLEYSSEIPEMLVDYNYFKNKGDDYELPEPPQLPAHLNNVLLNKMSPNLQSHQSSNISQSSNGNRPALRRADSSYYASNGESYHLVIPNHVILNHLMTTSIRNDVLTVACITRYSGKFVTQVMHSPADVLPEP